MERSFLDHYTPTLCGEIAADLRLPIARMMNRGTLHRQALFMHFAIAAPELGFPWYREVATAEFGTLPSSEWDHPFDKIARGKNRISGRTGELSRTVQLLKPELLLPSDVRFWGNWKEGPIMVACSAAKPWYDMAISKMACGLIVAYLDQVRFEWDQQMEALGVETYQPQDM